MLQQKNRLVVFKSASGGLQPQRIKHRRAFGFPAALRVVR